MVDIGHLFAIDTSPWELIVRGSVVYWFLLLVFRFILRRDPGALGIATSVRGDRCRCVPERDVGKL